MKFAKYIIIASIALFLLPSCSSAEKAATERRNLMMPEKSDLKRNDKYKASKKSKTYSTSKKKKKKKNYKR